MDLLTPLFENDLSIARAADALGMPIKEYVAALALDREAAEALPKAISLILLLDGLSTTRTLIDRYNSIVDDLPPTQIAAHLMKMLELLLQKHSTTNIDARTAVVNALPADVQQAIKALRA